MLRLGIDVSPLALSRAGTARYLRALLAGLQDEAVEVDRYELAGDGRLRKLWRDTAWYLEALPRAARRSGIDVLHCPTQRAPVRSRVPLVVTFHDLAVLRHPDAFNRWTREYSRRVLPRVAEAATRLIAVSEFTKRELLELLDVPEDKVRVIPNAVGEPFTAEGEAAEGDYVLAVSTLEPRKNLPRLVEGFERAGLNGLPLLVAGAAGWGGVRVDGDGVRWLGEVGDDELARLYRGARCVAYVSLYEGFGLPVLEAMACGTPVVAPAGPPSRRSRGVAVARRPARRRRDRGAACARPGGATTTSPRPLGAASGASGKLIDWRRAAAARTSACTARPARVSAPLVVIDADVLGRQRTGDETYVAALLRELAIAAPSDLHLAPITRQPELVPAAVEPLELPAKSQIAAHGLRGAAPAPPLRPALAHFVHALPLACPCPAVLTVQDLSFERLPAVMGRRDRLALPDERPALGAPSRTRADDLGGDETRPDRALRHPRGEDRRHAARRRPDLHARGPAPDGEPYALFVGALQPRKEPVTAIEALSLLDGDPRLVLVGPDKGGGEDVGAAAQRLGVASVQLRGHVERDELAALYRGAACLVFPSATRASACRCSRRWRRARRSSRPRGRAARGGRRRGRPRRARRPGRARRRDRARARRPRAPRAAGLERAQRFTWAETARRTLEVYRELL